MKKVYGLLAALVIVSSSFAFDATSTALQYLKKNKTQLNLSDRDITDLQLMSSDFDDYSSIYRVWFQQSFNGIPLKNGQIGVHIKDGAVVNATNSGVFELSKQLSSVAPAIDAATALTKAASFVNTNNAALSVSKGSYDKKTATYTFPAIEGFTKHDMYVKLLLTKDLNDKVLLVWDVQFSSYDEHSIWNIEINAKDASLVRKNDQVLHCAFGEGGFLAAQHTHSAECTQRIDTPADGSSDGTAEQISGVGAYRVYPFTVESPSYGSRQLINDPNDLVASPWGWHDTNNAAGAEFTITRGNNVYAYTDKDGNNSVDANSAPDGGVTLNFDFPLDFTTKLDTLVNSKAVVTQLFYMNNIMHDLFVKYGFTEAAGNFQATNYSGAPGGNDFVWAEAHDGILANPQNKNNANFYASPDGTNTAFNRSRMQMFMWDGVGPSTLTYNAPGTIAGEYEHGVASGWGPCAFNITGQVANAVSSSSNPPSYVCNAVTNPADIAGKIALIDRGTCNFTEKVLFAQQAGAIGALIINRQSAGDSIIGMAAGTGASLVTIPAFFVTYATGQLLRDNIGTANITMARISDNGCLDFDGSLDNGIIAHEYGHGISIRLTGGRLSNTCLNNAEQGGEGWSDFFALALTKKPADNKNTARGIGNYATGQSTTTGVGIRRYPYSYDMTVNPLTYADVATSEGVHAIGEIWCSAIWDMYWELVEANGYSTDLYNGTGGNVTALKLVVEGLKQQPCSPGYVDARNAILKADSILYNKANTCLIWKAFARRGLGASATQGSSQSSTDQVAAFNLPASCNLTPTATASFTLSDTTVCIGGSLTFTNTSTATSGSPDSVRWTIGGGVPATSNSTTTVNATFNSVGIFTISLIAYKSGNASPVFSRTIRVKPNAAIALTSAAGTNNQTRCVGTAITNVTYAVTGGGTGAGVTGLPTGVTGSFSGGVFTISGTPSATGTFNYTVTTTGSCTQTTATGTIVVNPNAAISLTSAAGTNNQSRCVNTAITNITYAVTGGGTGAGVTGLPTGVTGTYSGGVFTISGTPTATGTFNYTVTTTGTCTQATATGTIVVTASSALTLTSAAGTNIQTKCANTAITTITYSVTGATGAGVTGLPSGVNGNFAAGVFTISGTPTGNGVFNYTVTTTGGCTTSTATGTITVNANPSVTVNSPTICSGQTANLTANGATTYAWSPNIGSAATVTTPVLTSNTAYTVTGTSNGCTGTAVANVTVTALPNVTVNSPTICSGSTATLTAGGATTYSWSPNIGSTATVTTPVLTSNASYTVTGTTGSCSKTAVATVTVTSAAPTVSITPSNPSVCLGDQITLTANGANTYTWTSSQTGTTSGSTLTFTPNGNITVNLSGTLTGCSTPGNTSTTVTVKPKPTVAVNSPAICSGSTASLTATGATTYSWSPNIGSTAAVTTPVLTSNTSYTVTGTTDGCTNSAVASVTVNARPTTTLSASTNSVCSGGEVVLNAGGATTYSWIPDGSGTTHTINPTSNVTYTVTGTSNGCTSSASQSITITAVPATPSITQSNDTLYSSTILAGAQYKWYRGGVLQSTTSTPFLKITSEGLYTLEVVSGSCTSALSAGFSATLTAIRNASNTISLFELYPNPTDGRLIMNLSLIKNVAVQVSIFSPEGREMYVKSYANTRTVYEELNITSYAKGVYIIRLNIGDELFYHKVVRD
jgi:extracellular elastinolytic metalloproteinase